MLFDFNEMNKTINEITVLSGDQILSEFMDEAEKIEEFIKVYQKINKLCKKKYILGNKITKMSDLCKRKIMN
jgi:hypothetical protein